MGFKIEKFNLNPIVYYDMKKRKFRKYYPDFIIDNFLIIEVKHIDGYIFEKKKEEIKAKSIALENFCKRSDQYLCLFVTNKMIDKKYVDTAKKIHKKGK